ncbi:unnamed protein product [Sphenostylis stenocarpa]|uniref:Uncharacterized protein n=1 Tax=Sphenostylis stenocarpa TaxID=92480 RepID=A0AA86SPN7_9FABA|nr:unnamed protein product [Sphenostylis stenocarpa]
MTVSSLGDFNVVLGAHEKFGGKLPKLDRFYSISGDPFRRIREYNVENSTQEATPIPHDLSPNASKALRRAVVHTHGGPSPPLSFILQTAPKLNHLRHRRLKNRNTSHPFWFLKTLLLYHTTTYNPFSFHDLLNMSQGTCLTTLLRHKNISLTKVDRARNSVEINNVGRNSRELYCMDREIGDVGNGLKSERSLAVKQKACTTLVTRRILV